MAAINVGVVGLGWAASGHLPAFQANPDIEVVALCSSKELSTEQIREMCGNDAALYHDYDEFLQHPDLDVVDICTPHHLHPPQAIQAAEAGKHLMIEKPLAVDYESLLAMRNAIEAAGVKSTVYFELRFIPHFDLVRSVMAQGLLGDVHHFEVDYYHGIGPWYAQYEWNVKKEIGRSALITAGVHALDALLYFADRAVEEVCISLTALSRRSLHIPRRRLRPTCRSTSMILPRWRFSNSPMAPAGSASPALTAASRTFSTSTW